MNKEEKIKEVQLIPSEETISATADWSLAGRDWDITLFTETCSSSA